MVDWFVALSPLAVLAIVLVLGFAGCDIPFVVKLPLVIEVRDPSALTIVESRLVITDPETGAQTTITDLEGTDDGSGTTVLRHYIGSPSTGTWKVDCGLVVRDATTQDSDQATVEFILGGGDDGGTATFEASGAPATSDFDITFTGFVPNG
jgi:hypothetical protein